MEKEVIVFETDRQLAGMIIDYKGHSQATIEMTTQPKFNKKSRLTKEPFEAVYKGNVVCTSTRYVSIGHSYAKAVQTRLIKEGKITADQAIDYDGGSLPWGKWIDGSKILIEHKDQIYLRLTYLNANGYMSEKIYHYEDGTEIEDELIERLSEFLPPENNNNKFNLDEPIIVNSIKLSGITSLRFDAKIFVRKGFEGNENENILKRAKEVWGESSMSKTTEEKFNKIKKNGIL